MKIVQSLYNFLDIGKSPRPADCIYVLSGQEESTAYGIKMWRIGYASHLILSSRESFIHMDHQREVSVPIKLGFLEMQSEARELARCLRDYSVRSMIVLSSPKKLRCASIVFRRAFRKKGVNLIFVAVPENSSSNPRAAGREIWSEFLKYLFYRLLVF